MSTLPNVFAALGDPTRFAIVERLLTQGALNAGDLQRGTDISAPAISRHLKVLHNAGILDRQVRKQQRIYSVRPEAVQTISAWTISHRDFWEASLNRLEKALMQEINRK